MDDLCYSLFGINSTVTGMLGCFVGIVGGFTTLALYCSSPNEKNFETKTRVINPTYDSKRDSLENAYKLQIDSLTMDYQNKLNDLELEVKD